MRRAPRNSRPPSKLVVARLADEVVEALNDYARAHSLPKREVIERAMILELKSPQPIPPAPSRSAHERKVVSSPLPIELADAFDEHVRSRGLMKGQALDRAIARVVGLPYAVTVDAQGEFQFPSDSTRRAS